AGRGPEGTRVRPHAEAVGRRARVVSAAGDSRCSGAARHRGLEPDLLVTGNWQLTTGMDLRKPIGILFLVYGLILVLYGLASPLPALDLTVNAIGGVVLALSGAAMLTLAWRARGPRQTP